MSQPINEHQRALINIIQSGLPIDPQPYMRLAEQLGTTESHVLEMISELKESGHIKRLGAIFDSKKLGYKSTLCAIQVPDEKMELASKVINSYSGVTHNYIRDDVYNMWFTLIAPSKERIEAILEEIREKTGIEEVLNLPATQLFKINVNFDIKE